jgi:hypothetical protein
MYWNFFAQTLDELKRTLNELDTLERQLLAFDKELTSVTGGEVGR